jgi:Protein of unknown function (DUF3307)
VNTTLVLITLLFTKHFVVDFPLQKPYQWRNKGTYAHFGGILHAGLHGTTTALVLMWYASYASILLGLFDMVVHYHIDWAKMNINQRYGWGANTHEQFWTLLGLDQYLHALTYIFIVSMITS